MNQATITERADVAHHDRRLMALYYAWGREDAGDRRLRDASTSRVVVLDFAAFAAEQAAAYIREGAHSLASVQDQYARYIVAISIGARHIHQATGDEIEITAYDDAANVVHARTIHTAGHPDPNGRTFTSPPAAIAGNAYRPAPTKPTSTTSTGQR